MSVPGKDCREDADFPKRPTNPPALPRIGYRIGTYADFRGAMLRALDADDTLAGWTHRDSDDPGIALLEGAAMLGDILTFYQELYANEAFLRTAQWDESVTDLVRLLGYRLSPGLGGRGTFWLEIRGERPVTVPAGFALRLQLEASPQPAIFETAESLVAYPWLSRFRLFRPLAEPDIESDTGELRIPGAAGVEFEEGDRLLVGEPSPADADSPDELLAAETVVVEEVRTLQGQTVLRIKGSLRRSDAVPELVGYKLGRSFRHFGHNAPRQDVTVSSGGDVVGHDVDPYRTLTARTTDSDHGPHLSPTEFPLDIAVDDLAQGTDLICVSRLRDSTEGTPQPHVLVRTVDIVRTITMRWGALSGASTLVGLDSALNVGALDTLDIREIEFHEAASDQLSLYAAPEPTAATRGETLYVRGPVDHAHDLDGRRIVLHGGAGAEPELATVVDVEMDAAAITDPPALHRITLDREVDYAGFPNEGDGREATANVVDATQGESVRDVVLGDGDSRRAFQTFRLPDGPLTYHYEPDKTPPEVPQLEIYVEGRRWERVDSLFGGGGDAEVYVVRRDAEGEAYAQFGDGVRLGARLPSGNGNVVARVLRKGSGARGPTKPGVPPKAKGRLDGLDAMGLHDVVSGGDDPENRDHAREAAPGRARSLGRLVSLQDFESETLQIPGVAVAAADWALEGGSPAVVLTVLMESGRAAEFEAVRRIVQESNRTRGPDRFPVRVREGRFLYVHLDAVFAPEPGRAEAPVHRAVEAVLGVTGRDADGVDGSHGLFALRNRRFGRPEYASRALATIQNVDGVAWARITGFGPLGSPDDPAELEPPSEPRPENRVVACPDDALLALHSRRDDGVLQLRTAAAGVVPGARAGGGS